ncbi:unnamed protein product [Ectocarpus sp. 4 AP-2014]
MASGLGNYMMKSVGPSRTGTASPATQLYRAIAKEVPRILTIYDVDMDFAQARAAIALYFRKNGHLKDPRVVDALVMKGYMDLEETTMQYKQKTHLLRLLNPSAHNDARVVKDDFMDKFMAGTS